MKTNRIRLTESQLNRVIKESVRNILNEDWADDFNSAMDKKDYLQAKSEYDSKSLFKRILAMIGGNKPKDPNAKATLNKYVESFNREHNIGQCATYNDGSSFGSAMKYDSDDGYPVLKATHYDPYSGAYHQSRRKFNPNGNEEEWGIAYPYSETGVTLKDLPQSANDDAKRQYDSFNRNREEIRNVINQRNRQRQI